ncbi:sensor histidine kinase [Streptomyces sp. NPDC002851]
MSESGTPGTRPGLRPGFSFRPPRAAWATALTVWLCICAAAAWLAYAGARAGTPQDADPGLITAALVRVDWPRWWFLLVPIGCAVVCGMACTGRRPLVRLGAMAAAAVAAGLLHFAFLRWVLAHDFAEPPAVADAAVRWSVTGAPLGALAVGAVVWLALGNDMGPFPLKTRLTVLASGITAAVVVAAYRVKPPDILEEGPFDSYRTALALCIPATALLTDLLVNFVAARPLHRVEAIRRQLAHITSHSLHQRVPVPPSSDAIARLAVTMNDTLDRLEQASARQHRLVADASHELRSPLAALRAQLESALRHPEGVEWQNVVDTALFDVVRLQRLADDLLLLSRLDGSAHSTARAEPVDLAALAEDLVREYQHLPAARDRFLRYEAAGPAIVVGDASQLERMLRNLLDNACRHATAHIRVQVRAALDRARVLVEVSDDGPGIPQPDRDRVFERFTRLDEARTRADGGAGLGLPIARDIAARHGGTLTVADGPGAHLVADFRTSARQA